MAEDTYINTSYQKQALVAEFIRQCWLEPQIEELKGLYEPRLYAALRALDGHVGTLASWQDPNGGFLVGVTLKGDVDTDAPFTAGCGGEPGLDGWERLLCRSSHGARFCAPPVLRLDTGSDRGGCGTVDQRCRRLGLARDIAVAR